MSASSPDKISRLISARGQHFANTPSLIQKYVTEISNDLFIPDSNPTGVVNLGVAENLLCEDLFLERFNEPDMNVFTKEMFRYFMFIGSPEFREALCAFFTRYFKIPEPLDANNVIVVSGVGSALDLLATFLADPGDCFLTPFPCYAGLFPDFEGLPQTRLLPVCFSSDAISQKMNTEEINRIIDAFDNVYITETKKGQKIRGLVLVNPNNPLGYVMPLSLISAILEFAKRYDMHVIYNAIYGLTVFDPETPITNVLQLSNIPDREKTYMLWGFSKDMNMSGIRCGVIYTENRALISCAEQYTYLTPVPAVNQNRLQTLIRDFGWLDKFFETNISRIRHSYAYCKEKLTEFGIPFKEPKAAFFIWADFRQFLREMTKEAEMELFKKLMSYKLFLLPGHAQGSPDPGWFRITIVLPMAYLQEGFSNLAKFIEAEKKISI